MVLGLTKSLKLSPSSSFSLVTRWSNSVNTVGQLPDAAIQEYLRLHDLKSPSGTSSPSNVLAFSDLLVILKTPQRSNTMFSPTTQSSASTFSKRILLESFMGRCPMEGSLGWSPVLMYLSQPSVSEKFVIVRVAFALSS